MVSAISPTQSNVLQALGNFLKQILPSGTAIVAGQQNRVAQPSSGIQVVMVPLRFTRLSTNMDNSGDVSFVGSIVGNVLSIEEVLSGKVVSGATVFGSEVAPNTVIQNQLTPTTFQITPAQTVPETTMTSGVTEMTQSAEIVVQLTFLSLDTPSSVTTAGDLAQTASTAFRDPYATAFFSALAPPLNGVSPLYADDPKQTPFEGEDGQYQWQWVLEAHLQVWQTVSIPQEYADSATIDVMDVDAIYSP